MSGDGTLDSAPPSRGATFVLHALLPGLMAIQHGVVLAFLGFDQLVGVGITLLFYFVTLPAGIGWLQRSGRARTPRFDGYHLLLAEFAALNAALWIMSVPVMILYGVAFAVLRRAPYPRTTFTLLVAASAAAILATGGSNGRPQLVVMIPGALILVSLLPYVRAAGAAFQSGPARIPLALGLVLQSVASLHVYMSGATTPWAIPLVTHQPAVELLRAPSGGLLGPFDIEGPRAVLPARDGLMIYANNDAIFVFEEGQIEHLGQPAPLGRVDLPIRDPDDGAFVYFPHVGVGLTSIDLRDGSAETLELVPAHYDLIHADPTRRYFAVVSDNGDRVSFAERQAPGSFEPLASLYLPDLVADWAWARAVDIDDDGAMIVVRSRGGQLRVYGSDMRSQELELLMQTEASGHFESWHAVTIRGERLVYTALTGQVDVYDWSGARVSTTFMAPLVRQILYDPDRRLCHLIDDFGSLMILDPFSGQVRKRFFGGFKTKNLHFEGPYLYFGSSAGAFRIDLDRIAPRTSTAEAREDGSPP